MLFGGAGSEAGNPPRRFWRRHTRRGRESHSAKLGAIQIGSLLAGSRARSRAPRRSSPAAAGDDDPRPQGPSQARRRVTIRINAVSALSEVSSPYCCVWVLDVAWLAGESRSTAGVNGVERLVVGGKKLLAVTVLGHLEHPRAATFLRGFASLAKLPRAMARPARPAGECWVFNCIAASKSCTVSGGEHFHGGGWVSPNAGTGRRLLRGDNDGRDHQGHSGQRST